MTMQRERTSFYDKWLELWSEAEAERAAARKGISEEELDWVQTRQDWRAALLVAPENGFRTWGSVTMVSEIPEGHHTGAHSHGEEAVYIVSGSGCSVVDGVRYDWQAGSALAMPFGAVHQHFNTGDTVVRYVSAMSIHLEHLAGVHRTTQVAEKEGAAALEVPSSSDGFDAQGRRIVLLPHEASDAALDIPQNLPSFDASRPLVLGDREAMERVGGLHKSRVVNFMRVGKDMNGFVVNEQEISSVLTDPPHEYGGTHAHMEAHLYVIEGEGYTVIDGEKVPWAPGSAIHIAGPQTVHQHVNTGDVPSRMLRVAFGIRYLFERAGKTTFPYLYISPRQGIQAPPG